MAPAKLTGKLVLKNNASDQSVRLVDGKFTYIDAQGKPIVLEDKRTEPILKIASSYGTSDRLDPDQEMTQSVEAEFPVEALKASRLKEIRLGLNYLPAPFKSDTLSFAVSIGTK